MPPFFRSRDIALALVSALVVGMPQAAQAKNSIAAELMADNASVYISFSIPEHSVADALILFAEQSGEQLIFRFGDAKHIPAKKLNGSYRPVEALLLILKGTGLKAFRNPEGTIVIQKDPDYKVPQTNDEQTLASKQKTTSPPLVAEPFISKKKDNKPEEIVITGSRIQRQEFTSPNVVAIIKSENIKRTGTANIEDLLNKLPQIVPALTGTSNNPGEGIATVNMRGLGARRTLVLLNGRRYVPSSQAGVTDLNTIPTFLIDKVEVATGGTSAVYGADAVAGVVNFKLRDDIEGFEGLARYRISQHGDGEKSDINLAYGQTFDNDRGHVLLHLGVTDRNAILQGDRKFSRYTLSDSFIAPGSADKEFGYGDFLPPEEGGIPGLVKFGSYIIPEGLVIGIPENGPYPGLERFGPNGEAQPFDNQSSRYNYAPANFLQLPQRQLMATFSANYQLTESLEIFNQVIFSRNKVDLELAATPLALDNVETLIQSPFLQQNAQAALRGIDWYATGDIWQARDTGGALLIDDQGQPVQARQAVDITYGQDGSIKSKDPLWDANGAPIAAVGAATAGEAGELLFLADGRAVLPQFLRRMSEAGSRQIKNNRQTINAVIGLQGEISPNWNFVAHYNYSHYQNTSLSVNAILDNNLREAINIIEVNGEYVCKDETARQSGCVPANVFGAGNLSPEAINYITVNLQEKTTYSRQDATVYFNGTFDSNLEDDAKLLVGLDWRREDSSFKGSQAAFDEPVSGFNRQSGARGGYHVWSFFSEAKIPIIEHKPLFENFEISGAIRYSDYNLANNVWTFAAGLNWNVVSGLRLRSQYQHAVKEPSIEDLYTSETEGFQTVSDPCSLRYNGDGTVVDISDIKDICIATGVPSQQVGKYTQLASQIRELYRGNAQLKSEISDTITIGAVIQPTFIPHLNITFDYYHIALRGLITSFAGGAAGILNLCYDGQDSRETACEKIHRNISGELAYINSEPVNTGEIITSGLDGQLHYSHSFEKGLWGGNERLEILLQGSYLLTNKYRIATNGAFIACAGYFAGECDLPLPHFRLTQLASWRARSLELSVRWRHIGRVKNQSSQYEDVATPFLPAKNYFDTYLQYQLSDNTILRAGVDNIFNTTPDFVGTDQQQANTFPNVYDTLGAYFHFGINVFY